MDLISLLLAVLAMPVIGAAGYKVLKLEQQTQDFVVSLREDTARLVELRYHEALGFQLEAAPLLTENIVDSGTTVVQELHRGLTRIPFGIMKSIPLVRQPSEIVRQTHDLISDAVYDSVRDVNKAAGRAGHDALLIRRQRWQKLIDKRSGRRR